MNQPLVADQGSTFTWDFLVRANQSIIFDLDGFQVRGQIRQTIDSTTVLLTPSFTISVLLGKITMTIPAQDTSALSFKGDELECVYDVEIFNGISGQVIRIVGGTFTITKEVTQ